MDNLFYEFLWVASSLLVLIFIFLAILYLVSEEGSSRLLGFSFLASILIMIVVFNTLGSPPNQAEKDFLKLIDWTQIRVKGEQEFEVSAKMKFKDGRFIKIVPEELKQEIKANPNLY